MRTVKPSEYTVYKLNELNEAAQQKAIESLYDINISHDWWEYIYEDAKQVGLAIEAFDLGRGSYCELKFNDSAMEVAKKILNNHGPDCETYKTCLEFVIEVATMTEDSQDFEEHGDIEDTYQEKVEDFKKSLSEDYYIIFQRDFEYLTSQESIKETIEANDYDFTIDGELN